MMMHRSSDERTLQMAVALVERGVLTQPAARAIAFFSRHGLFCQPIQTADGAVNVICHIGRRVHCYSQAAWNALIAGHYPPTPDDLLTSISALAATPAEEPASPVSAPQPDAPEPPPTPGSPEADAELEQLHQAASQRPGGAGALAWGLGLLLAVGAAIAAFGFWQVAQLFWAR